QRAAEVGVDDAALPRLAVAFAAAARYVSRHADALAWVERALASAADPRQRATLLRARIAVCRQLDVKRVLELADEALAAAVAVGDTDAYASVLCHAAFAAYRAGDARAATRFANKFDERQLPGRAAALEEHRAKMFAATARGDTELSI